MPFKMWKKEKKAYLSIMKFANLLHKRWVNFWENAKVGFKIRDLRFWPFSDLFSKRYMIGCYQPLPVLVIKLNKSYETKDDDVTNHFGQ